MQKHLLSWGVLGRRDCRAELLEMFGGDAAMVDAVLESVPPLAES